MIKIQQAGLDQLLSTEDGGTGGHLQILAYGDPGVGKTPWAAQFPKAFFLMADRNGKDSLVITRTPFVEIRSVAEMEEALTYVEKEVRAGRIETVVWDTTSVFQKHVEQAILRRLKLANMDSFKQWGELTAEMIKILHRIQNLPCNVIVLCHTKSKFDSEEKEIEPDLSGGYKAQLPREFSFICHIQQEWGIAGPKGKEQKTVIRTASWRGTPQMPHLRSPSNVLPPKTPVNFDEGDYLAIVNAIKKSVAQIGGETKVVEEIQNPIEQKAAPADAPSGAVAKVDAAKLPKARAAAPKAKPAAAAPKTAAPEPTPTLEEAAAPGAPAAADASPQTPATTDAPTTATPEEAERNVREILGGTEIPDPEHEAIDAVIQEKVNSAKSMAQLKSVWAAYKTRGWDDVRHVPMVKARQAELGL